MAQNLAKKNSVRPKKRDAVSPYDDSGTLALDFRVFHLLGQSGVSDSEIDQLAKDLMHSGRKQGDS